MTYELTPSKRIQWCSLFRLCAVLTFVFSLISISSVAQPHLERISKAERSDGLGYVVRYHFSTPIDSFTVIQPAPDLIQMELFAEGIDTTGIQIFEQEGKIQEVRLYNLESSYGVDIYLDSEISVISKAYLDQNGSDILLALTKADPYDVDVFTQQFLAKNWYLNATILDSLEISPISLDYTPEPDDRFNIVQDKLKFDKVVIDAGHGGKDVGTIGHKKTYEKDITLQIALKVGAYIEELIPGVEVIYTRKDDTFIELEERGRIANRAEADLFISIHADGFKNTSVRGSSVFFLGLHRSNQSLEYMTEESQLFENHGVLEDLTEEDLLLYELANNGKIATSERFAYMVEDQLRNRAKRKSRGVKQMGLVVLYTATMPAILVETGFLTNPSEQRYLTDPKGQEIIASAIYRAVKEFKQNYERTRAMSSSN